ncbi:MAG: DEAD/DEAH box helicase [Pyrinomonadaceae bacterium]|jgi:ATP-dependent RNA helicase DeaD|nr:DEAD/DEAH box helicase [Pyrinomonadaceae bacterium]
MSSDKEATITFADFGFTPEITKAIKEIGYETPSPIQLKTIPLLLDGNDIIGQAQTGTGKTAAFALPILQNIQANSKALQAIVLTPTRELAIQVAEAIHSYAKYTKNVRVLPIYGGQSIFQQMKHLRNGIQIIVGTPGRVMDHMRRETINFDNLKMVVLDEADEMLRMGFIDDVEWILSHTSKERQTALFSATMPREVRRIAERHLNNPSNVEIERKTLTVPAIEQTYVNVSESQKLDVLTKILEAESNENEAIIIFQRTRMGCDQLADKLQARGYTVEAMHGDMNQNQREAVIKKLKTGKTEIVVATDVAARGLDVERISVVVNYDMPSDTESYVHRIGRTGRAGRKGKAILFVTPRQIRMKRDIEHYTKQQIVPMKLPTQADIVARRVSSLKEKIINTLTEQELDLYLTLVEDFAEESGCDIAEIAAAAIFLSVGDKRLEVTPEVIEIDKFNYSEEGMVKLFFNVGRNHRISPSDIVGAIANEAKVPGKAIGAIDVNDTFTLVDVPKEFIPQILSKMRNTKIRSKTANIRVASENQSGSENKSFDNRSFENKSFDNRSNDDRKPRRKDKKSGDGRNHLDVSKYKKKPRGRFSSSDFNPKKASPKRKFKKSGK